MKIDQFTFYKVQKNEDANPYVHIGERDGFIAVADGLGGAGSFVHELSSYDYCTLEKRFKPTFLPEYFSSNYGKSPTYDEHFETWLDELIAPMIDKKPDTSALWGARIAIARFVHYLLFKNRDVNLSDENARQTIIDYIYKGMKETAKTFRLKPGLIQGQLILPTTLVGLKYTILNCDQISVDIVWAGDSRAYALVPGLGLKQLSRDDEDGSGAISNLFCIKEREVFDTKLNYSSYILPKKSIVFVCSDGFFDPYEPIDNIGVEAVFLDCLSKSNNFDELEQNWFEHFRPMTHDDCSVAFLAFGYDSFTELKSLFACRTEKIITLLNEYFAFKRFIPIVEGREENPEEYVCERAKQRKNEIAQRLAAEIITNPDSTDGLIVDDFYKLYSELQHIRQKLAEKKKNEAMVEACRNIRAYLLNNYDKTPDIFRLNDSLFSPGLMSKISYIVKSADNLTTKIRERENANEEYNENNQRLSSALAKCYGLKTLISVRQDEIRKNIYDYTKAYNYSERIFNENSKCYGVTHRYTLQEKKNRDDYADQKNIAQRYCNALSDLKKFLDKKIIPRDYKFVCYPFDAHFWEDVRIAIENYTKMTKLMAMTEKKLNQVRSANSIALTNYRNAVHRLDDASLFTLINRPDLYFSDWACQEFELPIYAEIESVNIDILTDEILAYFNTQESVFNELIRKFTYSLSPSIIDSIFNASRLRLCREYKAVDIEKVKALSKNVDEFMRESENVTVILSEKA